MTITSAKRPGALLTVLSDPHEHYGGQVVLVRCHATYGLSWEWVHNATVLPDE